LVVFEFCTVFARPKLKCIHPKFKKNVSISQAQALAREINEGNA